MAGRRSPGAAGEQLALPLAQEGEYLSWGAMFANARVDPLVRASGDLFDAEQRKVFRRLMSRLCAGDFDDDEPPARVHGDLWAGNVLFDSEGAVLIDPAAYSGHRLDDLAALHLFGAPHLAHVVEGYEAAHPLAHEWRDVLALHSLHLVLLHAALFGGGYAGEALMIARRYA
ncbi:fructosamine kinase family protein [Dermabacter jinjuensis]|uniref:fructosamine kinase family protein n=1 Tax=Dermabacter jinjuensis TaxID=1667168 RepID=UPI001D041B33|nr:fructosamine kinase family protein [Dermabacter jinjuensis]